MADTFRLMLQLKKWLFAPDANLEYCRCLLVRLVHQKCVSCTKMRTGIFCTQKGLRTHIFYPVKQLKTALPGMQNYAHLKQFTLDRQ